MSEVPLYVVAWSKLNLPHAQGLLEVEVHVPKIKVHTGFWLVDFDKSWTGLTYTVKPLSLRALKLKDPSILRPN